MVTQNRFASLAPSLPALLPTLPGARGRWGPENERWVEPRATVGVGWHQPPSRSPAPPRPRGRRTGGEKARVLSRLLASSYCVGASRIRLVIVSLARRPSSCLGLLSPPRTAFHSSPPEHAERASLGHSQAPLPPCASREVRRPRTGGGGAVRARSGSHTHLAIPRDSAGVSEPLSDAWPAARPPPKRPLVAATHRVPRDTFPPSLHLTIFQAPQLG